MRKSQGYPSSSPQADLSIVQNEDEPDRPPSASAVGSESFRSPYSDSPRSGADPAPATSEIEGPLMATYEVTLKDRTVEVIDGADAYKQEGQMTTFFCTRDERQVIDTWSSRIASFRTADILIIRRVERPVPAGEPVVPITDRRSA